MCLTLFPVRRYQNPIEMKCLIVTTNLLLHEDFLIQLLLRNFHRRTWFVYILRSFFFCTVRTTTASIYSPIARLPIFKVIPKFLYESLYSFLAQNRHFLSITSVFISVMLLSHNCHVFSDLNQLRQVVKLIDLLKTGLIRFLNMKKRSRSGQCKLKLKNMRLISVLGSLGFLNVNISLPTQKSFIKKNFIHT